jgi:uncharacterized protein
VVPNLGNRLALKRKFCTLPCQRGDAGRTEVLCVETIGKIRRRRLLHGESISAIARNLGLARNTVKRALRFEGETYSVSEKSKLPVCSIIEVGTRGFIVTFKISRRAVNTFLTLATTGAMWPSAKGASTIPGPLPEPRREHGNPLAEFNYGEIDFAPCLQQSQLEQTHAILMEMNNDSLLRPFRMAAGLPAPGLDLGGWYSATPELVPSGPSGPETFGQWLSALSRYFATTGDAATLAKLQQLIDGYAKSVEPSGRVFELSVNRTYFYDKLVCGLEDAYEHAGVKSALHLLSATTDAALPHLAGKAIDPLGPDGQKSSEGYTVPENQFIAWQRGGDRRYLEMARQYLADDFYFEPLSRGENVLARRHAYSHVLALSSAAKAYLVLGDEKYLKAAVNGLAFVEQQSFVTGGWGPGERFLPTPETEYTDPDNGKKEKAPALNTLSDAIEHETAHFETPCGAYAQFRLTRYLLRITKDARYGDSMERVMYNTVLGALPLNKFGKAFYQSNYHRHARKMYFDGYGDSVEGEWPCCSGTLPQIVADYRISTYFKDSEGIYVNLFIPSTARWEQHGTPISLTQSGSFPLDDRVILEITTPRSVSCTLRIRIPGWTRDPVILVNGKTIFHSVQSGTFAIIHRKWSSGDRIDVRLPRKLRLQPVDDQHPNTVALTCGPLVLFAIADDTPKVTRAQLLAAVQQSPGSSEWRATTTEGSVRLAPFWAIKDEQYFTYLSV